MPDLAITAETVDGRTVRLGPDEPLASDIPTGVSFSTSIPGGFKDAQFNLARYATLDYPEPAILDTIRIHGPGNETAWEGRVAQLPRSHGDSFSHQVGCVGWSAHLKDDATFTEIYVDQDISHWGPTSVGWKLALGAAGFATTDGSTSPDASSGESALGLTFRDTWVVGAKPWAAAVYDATAGAQIASIYYAWKKNANVTAGPDNFEWMVRAAPTDLIATGENTGDLQAAGPGTGTLTATNRRFGAVTFQFAAAGGTAGTEYSLFWTCLAVYGNHGLTKRGTATATEGQGFYASDILPHILANAAPKLTYTSDSIATTSFVIPQLEFRDPTDAEDAISRLNAYHLHKWGVRENREFFYQPWDPNTDTVWEAKLQDGAHLDLAGDQAEDLYNGVMVYYRDFTGNNHTVGPTGSKAESTSDTLIDTTETNPVTAHGLKRYAQLQLSVPTTLAGATVIGGAWLAEHSLPQRRGQLVVRRRGPGDQPMMKHPTAGTKPAWMVRAGDWVRIADHPADVPRRIIETGYDLDSGTLTCSLDNTSHKLEALLERIGIQQVGITTG